MEANEKTITELSRSNSSYEAVAAAALQEVNDEPLGVSENLNRRFDFNILARRRSVANDILRDRREPLFPCEHPTRAGRSPCSVGEEDRHSDDLRRRDTPSPAG